MKTTLDLIVFGGAFDPPHLGHLGCIQLVCEVLNPKECWIIPGLMPASASQSKSKKPNAEFRHRLVMCKILFEDVQQSQKNTQITVSDIEGHLATPNFTLQTLEALPLKYKDSEIGLLIGTDQLESFVHWKKPFEILRRVHLIVIQRQFHDRSDKVSLFEKAEAMFKALDLGGSWNQQKDVFQPQSKELKSIWLLDSMLSPAASTVIRSSLEKDLSVPKDWMHPKIVSYIQKHRLYEGVHGKEV